MTVVIANRYEVLREIGGEGHRLVRYARDRTSNAEVVVTQIALDGRAEVLAAIDALAREADVLRSIEHPCVPPLVEFQPVEISADARLVRRKAPGEALSKLTHSDTELLGIVEQVLAILSDIAPATHGALNAEHIILDGERVHLIGFGRGTELDLHGLATVVEPRPSLRQLADALRAPNASFRTARVAIEAARTALANSPSADEVARMRERAEAGAKLADTAEHEKRNRERERQAAHDHERAGRVRVDDATDGTTITIGRGQASWIVFAIVPPFLWVIFGLPALIASGAWTLVITLGLVGLIVAGLLWVTRPHRVLLTTRGDFVIHRGNPRKPVAIGRTEAMHVQVTTFRKSKGAVVGLYFQTGLAPQAWHPFTSIDVQRMRAVFDRYDVRVQSVHA
ncbi:MAG: hypothetical protein SFX73_04860 [Kofleriaceae bacterium]|nr:hypothetical protein [Kofleriaceae bacterium]